MSARIVFDLDGTLIDSAPDIHGIANRLLARAGLDLITLAETRSYIGNGAPVFVERMRAARGIGPEHQEPLLVDFKAAYMDAVTLTHPYPGVVACLDQLRGAGHRLGICTNKPIRPTHAVLDHLGLSDRFATVFGGDSLSVHKPDPAPLIASFDALGDGPCIYVGDSEVDAETAQRAEMPFFLFTCGYHKTPVAGIPHTALFDDFAALPDLIAQMLAA